MGFVKKVFKVIGAIVALLVVLVVGAVGYNIWLIQVRSGEARAAADELCASLPPGSAIEAGLARAKQLGIKPYELPGAAGYEFQFMYFLDGWGCRARVTDGKVTAVEVVAVN